MAAEAVAARGVRVSVVRLPQVHDTEKQGLVTHADRRAPARRASRLMSATGSTAGPRCTGSMPPGSTGWRSRRATAGARYHAVAEEGVPLREIAEAIGRGLKIPVVSMSPEEAAEHFGWLGFFAGMTCRRPARYAATAGMAPDGRPG